MADHHSSFVPTHAALAAMAVLDEAAATHRATLVLGPTGAGKSAALREYARRADFPDGARPVIFHQADVANTPRSVVCGLLSALGTSWEGTARSGLRLLRARMEKFGVQLVLIDDAQRLARNSLDMLRALREATGVGLALAGTPRLRGLLLERAPELAHQITHVHDMDAVIEGWELLPLVSASPRRRRAYWQRIGLVRALLRVGGGNFRRSLHFLDTATREARRRHRPLTRQLIERASECFRGLQ